MRETFKDYYDDSDAKECPSGVPEHGMRVALHESLRFFGSDNSVRGCDVMIALISQLVRHDVPLIVLQYLNQ